MLARAVVVERRRLLDRARLVDQRILFGGPVRAAFERRDLTPGAGQHVRGKRRMLVLAGMGRAGQRQFPVAEAIGLGLPALDPRPVLHFLACRTRTPPAVVLAVRTPPLHLPLPHYPHAS